VSGALVELQGPIPAAAQTNSTGDFAFSGLGIETQQIGPRKSGDADEGISALDAAYVLQFLVGSRALDAQQQLACDVTGNGSLSALDAALILQLTVGLINRFPAAEACQSDWLFVPAPSPVPNQALFQPQVLPTPCQRGAISYEPLTVSAASQDFLGMLLGDCTGNWHPTAGGGAAALGSTDHTLRLGRMQRERNGQLRLPVYTTERGLAAALGFELRYDAAAMRATGVHRARTAPAGLLQFNNTVAGVLRVAWASAQPLETTQQPILVVQFESRGGTPDDSQRALQIIDDRSAGR
jgi:hypothetical protein